MAGSRPVSAPTASRGGCCSACWRPATAVLTRFDAPADTLRAADTFHLDWTGLEGAVTLVIAVAVTTMFNNGFWQRVIVAR